MLKILCLIMIIMSCVLTSAANADESVGFETYQNETISNSPPMKLTLVELSELKTLERNSTDIKDLKGGRNVGDKMVEWALYGTIGLVIILGVAIA